MKEKKGRSIRSAAVSIFGATGVVGTASGVIAAPQGAVVTFVGYDGAERVGRHAAEIKRRFGVDLAVADGSTAEKRAAILELTEVALCAARAGVRVLDASQIATAARSLSLPTSTRYRPLGIEGVDLQANVRPAWRTRRTGRRRAGDRQRQV